ncbi:MBL fold metallo-hydrolase [Halobaculum sp. MBLA0147]|uniref:MBL fold metallo-hydrolase n=1 Tax=Halobaculum sp. MBLA0147 TaxID=3079934 RepID=UPI003526015C
MDVTLLGTGDATGVPAALCDCEYCVGSAPRLRPAVLVEHDDTTVVLDVGPDLCDQLQRTDTYSVDAFFLTHFHRDHADGLLELLQTLRTGTEAAWNEDRDGHAFDLYMTETATEHLRDSFAYFLDTLDPQWDPDGTTVGGLAVDSFPVEHMRPEYETVGFLVRNGDSVLAYAPDMATFVGEPPTTDVDLFVCEGSPVVGGSHGTVEELRAAVDAVDADRTVLVNATEHGRREHTEELAARAREFGCELGADFDEYTLS